MAINVPSLFLVFSILYLYMLTLLALKDSESDLGATERSVRRAGGCCANYTDTARAISRVHSSLRRCERGTSGRAECFSVVRGLTSAEGSLD